MTILRLLHSLTRAGARTLAIDPVAGRVRWQGAPVDDALRTAVAASKAELLALADGEALVIAPLALLLRIVPPALLDACAAERWQAACSIAARAPSPAAYHIAAAYIETRKAAALARLTAEWARRNHQEAA